MATRTAELAIDITTNASAAVGDLNDVKRAAGGAGDSVAKMGADAEKSARKLGVTADQADELGGKAGKATGALGALSSGFELMGPSGAKYAGGLQAAALATDFMSGVGDSLNLVMESTVVKTTLAKTAAIGHSIATKASAAATGVMTGAQWLLNAAMSANPILLVVIGLTALVAAFILAYKKSETFRAIVTGAMQAVTGAASAVFDWFQRNWPLLLAILTGPFGLATLAIVKNWDKIKNGAGAMVDWVTGKFSGMVDFFRALPGKIAKIFDNVWDGLADGLKAAINAVLHLPLKIPRIDTHIPGVGVVGGQTLIPALASGGIVTGPTLALIGEAGPEAVVPLDGRFGNVTNNYYVNNYDTTVNGALDPVAVGNQIDQIMSRRARRL